MPHKVLYVSEAAIYGGAERYLIALTEGIDRNNFDVCMLVSNHAPQRLTDDLDRINIPYEKIAPIQGKRDLKNIWAHIKTFKKWCPDIVHFNLSNPLHGQYGMFAARLANVPVQVATLHLPPRKTTPTRRGRFFERQTICKLHTLIAVCHASQILMTKHFDMPQSRTTFVYNGIDTCEFDNQATAQTTQSTLPNQITIGTVGRLSPQKGFDLLLKAMAQVIAACPNSQLHIAGEGPQKDDLHALTKQLHLQSHIKWLGMRNDIPSFLKSIQIFVLPSRYESFSISLLEAMAAGLPIVTTHVDGAPEAITNQEHGLLVPSENPQALADALITLIKDPQKRMQLGQAARQRVQTAFSLTQMVHKTEAVYRLHLTNGSPDAHPHD